MDKDTFWALVSPLQEHLFRFALSILKEKDEAEDAVHDVFLKLWHKRHQLNAQGNVTAFVLKATKHHCIDMLRRRGAILERSYPDAEPGVQPNYEETDMVEFVKKKSRELPLQQRMVLELKDFQGYDYKEICEVLEIPITTLRVNLSRARKSILKSLAHEFRKV